MLGYKVYLSLAYKTPPTFHGIVGKGIHTVVVGMNNGNTSCW